VCQSVSIFGKSANDFGTLEKPLPPETVRVSCVSTPIKISGNGLVVFFELLNNVDPPQSVPHVRCAADLTCQIFTGVAGSSARHRQSQFSGNAGNLCLAGECRPIARCPELVWAEEERNSGFADRWEAVVLPAQ
jgi:hypothetical protein